MIQKGIEEMTAMAFMTVKATGEDNQQYIKV